MEINTVEELEEKITALGDLDEAQNCSIVCALIGHSKIIYTSLGYNQCGRCKDPLAYEIREVVVIGHDCSTCRANFEKCDWKDKYLVADPFEKDEPTNSTKKGDDNGTTD